MKKIILVALIYATQSPNYALAFDATKHKPPTVIPIKTAFENNMMEMRISGSYASQVYHDFIDKEGVHYGKCMDVIFKSKLDSMVLVKLECGTILIPFDTSVQKMLVTKEVLFPLYPMQTYRTRFYAMCSQIHHKAPRISDAFKVGNLADPSLVKLANYIETGYCQNMAAQHAIWAYTDQSSFKELIGYGADSNSIRLTFDILDGAGINTPLGDSMDAQIAKYDSVLWDCKNKHTIALDSYLVYGGLGLIATFMLTTAYLIFSVKRKDNFTA